jgi:type I restriction enzyme S subunit
MEAKLPTNWRMTTLGGIAREKPNNGIFRKNPEYLTNGSGGLPVVWVEELFRGNSIDTKQSRRVAATAADVEKYGLKKGDVLFCRSSLKLDGIAFNNVYLGEDNAALFECHLIRISPKLEAISPVFLNWILRSPQFRAVAKSKSKTATMTTIDQQSLASIAIPLPPLAEQRRIAEVLDRAEALRVKRRAALAQLDSLAQSLFLDLFGDPATNPRGWPTSRVGDLGEIGTGSTPSRAVEENFGGEIPWVKTTEVNWEVITDTEEKITSKGMRSSRCKLYPKGSIVVALYGQGKTRGKAAVLGVSATTNQACGILQPSEKYDTSFLLQQFRLSYQRLRGLGRGGNQENLNLGLLSDFTMLLPPIPLQREFARRVTAVEALKTAQRASLAALDALFATLQHRAFKGEL